MTTTQGFTITVITLLCYNGPQFHCKIMVLRLQWYYTFGAVHKVCHAIFGQFLPPPVTLCHTSLDPPPKVRHTSRTPPPIFCRPSTKTRNKTLCTNSLSIVRGGFCPGGLSGGLLSGRFCSGWFLSICYNRKVNITLNFMFHMYDKKCISVTSHASDPLPR